MQLVIQSVFYCSMSSVPVWYSGNYERLETQTQSPFNDIGDVHVSHSSDTTGCWQLLLTAVSTGHIMDGCPVLINKFNRLLWDFSNKEAHILPQVISFK